MPIDYKDKWSEEYYNAIEDDKKSPDEAAKIADEKMSDYYANLIDEAKDRWKYREE